MVIFVDTDNYYPFGLTYNSYRRENSLENRIRFQGQEHTNDLGLGWDSFKWRNHQAEIGRFFNVDPLSEKYYHNSPYAFSENRVTSHIELEGLESFSLKNIWGGFTGLAQKASDVNTYKEIGTGMKEYGKKAGDMAINGARAAKNGVRAAINGADKLGSMIKGKFGDLSGPTEGITVTITTDGPAGPNGSYLPDAKDRSKNYNVDQSVIDGMGSIAKGGPPGARASNSPAVNPGEPQPSTLPVGEAISGTTGAAVPAGQAAQEVFKSKDPEPDSVLVTVQYGKDSTDSYYRHFNY